MTRGGTYRQGNMRPPAGTGWREMIAINEVGGGRARRRDRTRAGRWLIAAAGCAALALLAEPPAAAQFFGFGGGDREELQLVDQFDEDGNGRLDAGERRAAREWAGPRRRNRRSGGLKGRTLAASRPLSPADVATYPDRPLYEPSTLRTFFLAFENDVWEAELEAFYNTDVEVPATLVVDGESFPDVGVHFRGLSSYSRVPAGYKRSLNLSLDWVHDGADIDGYQTFNLLNSHEDPTFLRAVLYYEIARQYIPAPKANFLRLVINGENWGIYVHAQQFNSDFTREWFGTRDGARWKVPGNPRGRGGLEYFGRNPAAYRRVFEIKTDDDPEDWRDLIEFTRILNETPLDQLEAALEPVLDIDGALRFLALDAALVNSDGYWVRASDYNLYKDVDGRFHIIPHDANETFNGAERGRGFGGRTGGVTLDPLTGLNDSSKPLRSWLLAVPALRARYLEYVQDIAVTHLDWGVLGLVALGHQALIAEDVAQDVRRLESVNEFPADHPGSGSLRSFVDRRREFLLNYTMLRRLNQGAEAIRR